MYSHQSFIPSSSKEEQPLRSWKRPSSLNTKPSNNNSISKNGPSSGSSSSSRSQPSVTTSVTATSRATSASVSTSVTTSTATSENHHGRVFVQRHAIQQARAANNNNKTTTFAQRRILKSSNLDHSNCSVTESCTDFSSTSTTGRVASQWAWQSATIHETTEKKVVLQLNEHEELDEDITQSPLVTLPPTCWQDGTVVWANEYASSSPTNNNTTTTALPPDDLIQLTHLHEPAVVEALQLRFAQDTIYTATGPVLLALNPFTTLRGLYGETVQKKYWDAAERTGTSNRKASAAAPPPHVYQIADASFRAMMRALEDQQGTTTSTSMSSTGSVHSDTAASTTSTTPSTNFNHKANQSILVSGESGSGKTVTTKFVMKYLAALSQRSSALRVPEERAYRKSMAAKTAAPSPQRMSPSKTRRFQVDHKSSNKHKKTTLRQSAFQSPPAAKNSGSATTLTQSSSSNSTIEATVLQSNPILESFGNARTVRNDNSSRFGKFMELQFTDSGKLVGARMDTYLLETVRLVQQQAGERNFHVFYELLSGTLTASELSRFYLASTALPQDFKCTASCSDTYHRRDGIPDAETCHGLLEALQAMQFTDADAIQLFGLVAAILHASNLEFVASTKSEHGDEASCLQRDNPHLKPVCKLLGVTADDLEHALCTCHITAGKQVVRRSLNVEKANKGLEALLQTTYGAMFSYLVQRINDSIAGNPNQPPPAASIGVLDIFGFESFPVNSFEQLCINYCNEALQQQFNAFVLKNEQAEYEREGIEWTFIEFPENQEVLDLIEKRGPGLLSLLDDQCRAPGPSDKAFTLHVYQQCQSLPRFSASRQQMARLQFSVHHYAGPVEYTTAGFVEKNRDELPKETTELLQSSTNPFVQILAAQMQAPSQQQSEGSVTKRTVLHRADSTVGRPTVGGQFRQQLRELRHKIQVTTPHYVRCLKPNDMLVPDVFDTAIVAEQLRCGGILEAVRVARAGFTQHYPHGDFVRRYRALAWKELRTAASSSNATGSSSSTWKSGSSSYRQSYHRSYSAPVASSSKADNTKTVDSKAECKSLVKVLYRKLRRLEAGEDGDAGDSPCSVPSPAARAKTYSVASKATPSWSRASLGSSKLPSPQEPASNKAWKDRRVSDPPQVTPPPPSRQATTPSTWKRGGLTASDYLRVGIQMGKSKVFLRHHCFEALERMRSIELTNAATKLNSIFRRYLARIAYLPYRNAFRREIAIRMNMDPNDLYSEEKKEVDFDSPSSSTCRARQSLFANSAYADSLVDKWMTSQIRDAIHNPVNRNEWGKQAPSSEEMRFKWVLSDGLWIKNYQISEC